MKAFGGTCPVCCGDVVAGAAAVCRFCGFMVANYVRSRRPASYWLRAAGGQTARILTLPLAAAAPPPSPSIERIGRVG